MTRTAQLEKWAGRPAPASACPHQGRCESEPPGPLV